MTTRSEIDLTGRTAFVTGSATGLGKAFAFALAKAGANVTIADKNLEMASETASYISDNTGSIAKDVFLDQANPTSVVEAVENANQHFGTIDILVNNAALFSTLRRTSLDEITVDEWNTVLTVNLTGPFLCAQATIPMMREKGYGKIINITSTSLFSAKNRLAHYVASKMGVLGLTRVLARELGEHGINVNALSPGPTDTGASLSTQEYLLEAATQKSIQRIQLPEDVTGAMLFLSCPMSDFITGQHLVVDGGAYFN